MKALSIRISAASLGLAALLYFSACSPGNQNSNSNSNQVNGSDLKACDLQSDPGAHAKKIKNEIKGKMSNSLKKLLKDQENPNGTFTIEIQKVSNGEYYVAYVKGKVSGDDSLKELSNILNDFQNKEACLRVAYFYGEQSGPTTINLGDPGFMWSSCEHPMVVCPNGECCYPQ
jgi:hypothetical protein